MILIKDLVYCKPVEGHVGIEVEVEGGVLPEVKTQHWYSKVEPSLRGGREYINTRPLTLGKKKDIIETLTKKLNAPGVNVRKSHRTSIHVHNNVQDFTPTQLWTAVTGYWLVENLVFKWFNDPEREGNHFCLRLKDAEYLTTAIEQDIRKYVNEPLQSFRQDRLKYGALNLAAITNFGSVELRGCPGTTDTDMIDNWSTASYKILDNSRLCWESPEALLDFCYHHGPKRTAEIILAGTALEYLAHNTNNHLIEENVCRLINFVYTIDWDDYTKRMNKVTKKVKKDDYAFLHIDDGLMVNDEMVMQANAVNWREIQAAAAVPPVRKVRKKIQPQPNDIVNWDF